MPDPNKQSPHFRSNEANNAIKTPKVRKNPKFIGSQAYGPYFICKINSNRRTDDSQGRRKFKISADAQGQFTKGVHTGSGKRFPNKTEAYKGGMHGPSAKVPIAKNLARGTTQGTNDVNAL